MAVIFINFLRVATFAFDIKGIQSVGQNSVHKQACQIQHTIVSVLIMGALITLLM